MLYSLYHQNRKVFDFDVIIHKNYSGKTTIRVSEISGKEDLSHAPLGVVGLDGGVSKISLEEWLSDRQIPLTRDGWQGLDRTTMLFENYGLSLSDHYWFAPHGGSLRWEDVNFFQNPYRANHSVFWDGESESEQSPDYSSSGWLRKTWVNEGERHILLKGGSGMMLEPHNEVIASKIAKVLGLNHAPYFTRFVEGYGYVSACEAFTDEKLEFIPMAQIMGVIKKSNQENIYRHTIRALERVGVNEARQWIDNMIAFDYIIGNEDRHFNNFGILRDSQTLAVRGMAPIFDSGSSMLYQFGEKQINGYTKIQSKPFAKDFDRQLALTDKVNFPPIPSLGEIIRNQYNQVHGLEHRSRLMEKWIVNRLERVRSQKMEKTISLGSP